MIDISSFTFTFELTTTKEKRRTILSSFIGSKATLSRKRYVALAPIK